MKTINFTPSFIFNRKRLLICLILVLSILAGLWLVYHDSSEPPRIPVSNFETLDMANAVQLIADATVEGGAVGVVLTIEKDNKRYSATAGVANESTGQIMTDDLPLRIGSVSKLYTATVILSLVQQGLISLDDKISEYLPSDVIFGLANADTATVRQLLMHTSGIPDYYTITSYLTSDWTQALTLERTLPVAKKQSSNISPGERFEYSNMGYFLLGEVAEQVSGETFSDLLQTMIFQPLEVRDTFYNVKHPVINGVHGYGTIFRPWADTYDLWEHSGPDGGLMSTTGDVITFLDALTADDGKLKPIGDLMLEVMVDSGGNKTQGMGFEVITSKSGTQLFGHTGDVFGYQTVAFSVPDSDARFIAHVNCDCSALTNSLILNSYNAIRTVGESANQSDDENSDQ